MVGSSFRARGKRTLVQGRWGLGIERVRKQRIGWKTVVIILILIRRTKSVQMHVFNTRKHSVLLATWAF